MKNETRSYSCDNKNCKKIIKRNPNTEEGYMVGTYCPSCGHHMTIIPIKVCLTCNNRKHDIYWYELDGGFYHKNCVDFPEK